LVAVKVKAAGLYAKAVQAHTAAGNSVTITAISPVLMTAD
jgi:hypothetical protein